jgi:hypothetical protein
MTGQCYVELTLINALEILKAHPQFNKFLNSTGDDGYGFIHNALHHRNFDMMSSLLQQAYFLSN